MPSPLAVPADLLAALAGALARLRARWYVFGAQAVVLWGRPRLTADIDVTVRMDPEEPERLVEALAAAGFSVRIGAAPDFVRLTRVLPFVPRRQRTSARHRPGRSGTGGAVSFQGGAGDDRRSRGPGHQPGGSVATKVLAGRQKDLEDVRSVLRERYSTLDLDSVRSTLMLFEEALGQSDLRPVFERELEDEQNRNS